MATAKRKKKRAAPARKAKAPTRRPVKRAPRRAPAKTVRKVTVTRSTTRTSNPAARVVSHIVAMKPTPARSVGLYHLVGGADPAVKSADADKGPARCWRLPERVVKSKDFQAWARGSNYVVSATRAQLVAKLRRFA